jgi:hypothetical protein
MTTGSPDSPGELGTSPAGPPPLPASAPFAGLAAVFAPRGVQWVALAVFLASFVLPPEGLGVETCGFLIVTRQPCPGCGLTRSVASVAHGRFALAWRQHPFGFLVFPALAVLGLAGAWPRFGRGTLSPFILRHDRALSRSLVAALVALVCFGASRWVLGEWWFR